MPFADGRLIDWVSWTLNDAGLLNAWHALAPDRATTLCGRAVPVERIHSHWRLSAANFCHRARVCQRCRAKAKEEAGNE